MQLLNLTVDKIIIHQVFQRDSDGNKVAPTRSNEFTNFNASAMREFKSRVNDALGDGSAAVQMEIVDQGDSDLPSVIATLNTQSDADFAVSSYDIATKLTDAQQTRAIPGGITVIFRGTQGVSRQRYIGIIKAEVHSGYEKETTPTGEIALKFVEELLLTPGTRLYKTAAFFEKAGADHTTGDLNDAWAVMVADYQISRAGGKAAAQYFYSDFLGCGYPQTSARTTKQFYEKTNEFISNMSVSAEQKNGLLNALTTYMKADVSSTISASEFAERYLGELDDQDAYTAFIRASDLPDTAFTKDIAHIEPNLKYRKISFGSNVQITAPSAAFRDLIEIETIEGEPDESGTPAQWTKVIIKDRISNQK